MNLHHQNKLTLKKLFYKFCSLSRTACWRLNSSGVTMMDSREDKLQSTLVPTRISHVNTSNASIFLCSHTISHFIKHVEIKIPHTQTIPVSWITHWQFSKINQSCWMTSTDPHKEHSLQSFFILYLWQYKMHDECNNVQAWNHHDRVQLWDFSC